MFEGLLKVIGNSLESAWGLCGECLESVWRVFGGVWNCLEVFEYV